MQFPCPPGDNLVSETEQLRLKGLTRAERHALYSNESNLTQGAMIRLNYIIIIMHLALAPFEYQEGASSVGRGLFCL